VGIARSRVGRVWFLVFAAVAWVVVFGRLGYPSLLDPDEAHYAQLTREMIRARSWFVPLLDGSPFIDKPVLFHWLQIAAVWAFGESEFALRLPSALAGIGLLLLTRWVAAELFGRPVGNVAAMMFATLPFTFALANVALFDMVYTAFLFGAVACLTLACAQGRPRLQVAGYLLLTLAVMTKGPAALVLVLLWAAVAAAISKPARQALWSLHWGTGLLAVVVLASPWYV
jgi:4-amino-4-deoxy-L-arabinose transferase-like glycosyltransferase